MENLGTIIVSLVLLFIVAMVIRSIIKAKLAGKSASCSSCSSADDCCSTKPCCDVDLDEKLDQSVKP